MTHDLPDLGAYALGVLDDDEIRTVEAHVAGCAECRDELTVLMAMRDALGEVPPEAFLDGPPENDLLLQRTLRAVRAERNEPPAAHRFRRPLAVAAAVAALALVGALGGIVGRQTAPAGPVVAQPSSSATAGVRVLAASDQTTGATLTATLTPAAGWVRVHVKVGGVPAGTRCKLVVTSRDGTVEQAGSWLVSPTGAQQGTSLDGSAIIPLADVASVSVETLDGRPLVTAPA